MHLFIYFIHIPIAPHFVPYVFLSIVFLEFILVGEYWDLHVSMFGVNISKMGEFPNLIMISQSKRLNVKFFKKISICCKPPPHQFIRVTITHIPNFFRYLILSSY